MGTARGEHGKAGPQRVAQASEEARREWVTKRLVDYGRLRAQSLGWPDVYTLTKALGERVAEQLWSEADTACRSSARPSSKVRWRTRIPAGSTGTRWPTR